MNDSHRILYVDDDPGNRLVFEQSFGEKFPLVVVSSGEEALEALAKEPFAVLITDQRMPAMAGNELLSRAKELYPDVIRIIITAYDDIDPILLALNEGLVARYIVKPWRRDELENLLQWALETHALGENDSAIQLRVLQTERTITLGNMSRAVMHDMRQPLAFMTANAQTLVTLGSSLPTLRRLLEENRSRLPPADAENLHLLVAELPVLADEILCGCRMINRIMEDVNRLTRPARPEARVESRTDPGSVIRWILSACRVPAMAICAKLFYDGPTQLPSVKLEFAELASVLINLVSNAIQALESGPSKRQVTIAARSDGDNVYLTVSDNGPGMTPEHLAKVGTPFFTTREAGTGLGFSQCQRLIGRAGGEIDIESTKGKGTQVTLTLPR